MPSFCLLLAGHHFLGAFFPNRTWPNSMTFRTRDKILLNCILVGLPTCFDASDVLGDPSELFHSCTMHRLRLFRYNSFLSVYES